MAAVAALFSPSSICVPSPSRKATFYCSAKPWRTRNHIPDKHRRNEVEGVSQRKGKEDGCVVKSMESKEKSLLYDYNLEEQQAICFSFSVFFPINLKKAPCIATHIRRSTIFFESILLDLSEVLSL